MMSMKMPNRLSVWYVLATPVIAGMSTLELQIGGLNYTGYLWAGLLPLGLILLAFNRLSGADPGGIFPYWPWALWCVYVAASVLWCDELSRRNYQEVLQLAMPPIVGLIAASAIRTEAQLRALFVSFAIATVLLAGFALAYVSERFDMEWLNTHVRSAALTATLAGVVFMAAFPRRKWLPLAGWGVCILITTLTSSRIATAGLLMAPMIHPLLRHTFWKLSAACAIAGVGLALFYTETFQKHFFESGQGTLSDVFSGDFVDFGRADVWATIWNESWRQPWLGHGIGSAFDYVPLVWLDMYHVHNDYLRIFYELGLIGLFLFIAVMTWQMVTLRVQISKTDGIVRETFTAAWLGFWALLLSCVTDNTIIYHVFYINPLFAVLGAAYGVAWAERRARTPAYEPATFNVGVTDWQARLKNVDRAAVGVGGSAVLPQQGAG
jgi:O-antigen ligase